MRRVELGWGVVMEPDDFVPFVLGETVLVQEIESVVPLVMDAKVENTKVEFLGDAGEVVFWERVHEGMTNDQAPMTKEIPSSKLQ